MNRHLTRRAASRPTREIIETLRRRARSPMTIPWSGYDPLLTDLVLHDLDIRLPLGIPRTLTEERLWVAFHHLATKPAPGFTMGGRLQGLQVVATDTGWSHGAGAPVRGCAEAVLLAIGGRAVSLAELDGDGVPVLRSRMGPGARPGPLRRLAVPLRMPFSPQPRDRRRRDAVSGLPGGRPGWR